MRLLNLPALNRAGRLCILVSFAGAFAATASAEAPFNFDENPGMLPKTVIPSAYRIGLVSNAAMSSFTGHEDIDITVRTPVSTITLNQNGLKLTQASLLRGPAAAITTNDASMTAELKFPHSIAAGHYTLAIDYSGPILTDPYGIYRDDYKTPAGAARHMLVTQFEVADARRMFPGWDEPAFKATFQLTVTVPAAKAVVSNMPSASTTTAAGGMQRVVFATTPRMSTYLLALVAGDLSTLHAKGGSTPIELLAPTGTQDQGAYALHAATQLLPFYDNYFGVPYPLPKLSLIAIPNNYAAGAMENWGAITFIDNVLLFNPATSAPRTREDIYVDVAHEMSHQWSGDLVTMGWWDNIWLNEGFATWMETKATDHFNPGWEMWPRQHADREDAMAEDAQPTTHAIQQPIHDISEANDAFDDITYEKGEQVIRMIENWLGEDNFRDGMRLYMRRHAYGNTTSADLWAALTAVSHENVAAVGNSFTEQPGIPLVHFARACAAGETTITLTQDRFTIHDPRAAKLVWIIPVGIGAPAKPVRNILLTAQPTTERFPGCGAMLKANFGENGYYRTQYDPASLALLRGGFFTLGPADRANLLGDEFALFLAGRASLDDYLNLVAGLQGKESDVAVWQDTIDHLETLDNVLRGSPARPAFEVFARNLLRPRLQTLGWTQMPGESFLDTLLRPRLIAALGQLGDPATIAQAERLFAGFQKDPDTLPADLRDPVTKIVGLHADAATWSALRQLGEAAPDTEEKMRYFDAMAAAQDPALVQRNIAFATAGAIPVARINEFLTEAAADSDDPNGFLQEILPKMDPIIKLQGPVGDGYNMQMISINASDPALAAAILAQPSTQATSAAKLDAKKAADGIATNAQLRARAEPAVTAWLKGRKEAAF
jgi:aminopeptidase N